MKYIEERMQLEIGNDVSMEDDYMQVLLLCYAEIITADMPDALKQLRMGAIKELFRYLNHYRDLGYMPKLLSRIAKQKCEMLAKVSSKQEMKKVIQPHCPHFDGNRFLPDDYIVPEEELICWSETSLRGPLNSIGYARYMELFKQILPEESKALSL